MAAIDSRTPIRSRLVARATSEANRFNMLDYPCCIGTRGSEGQILSPDHSVVAEIPTQTSRCLTPWARNLLLKWAPRLWGTPTRSLALLVPVVS